ncbi:PREDICTED: notch-regulated ankyrin repeat-containing protein [Galeopterus variegatus]|uniref:Notch-regulated ankyrin repeat-containing protein n=1 Tax=Galeopterus variegatus TaxID=482537 RepID=A0ABM0R281_GALVR|nr:PREDICTED: notch-regulated ankyrin repeat-containing protein [Galeopterus variegatus]
MDPWTCYQHCAFTNRANRPAHPPAGSATRVAEGHPPELSWSCRPRRREPRRRGLDPVPGSEVPRIFQEAVRKGNTQELQSLLQNMTNCEFNVNSFGPEGQTALHQSVIDGNLELVKLLVKFGADIRLANRDGWSALHIAAFGGHQDIVLYLITKAKYARPLCPHRSPPGTPAGRSGGSRPRRGAGGFPAPGGTVLEEGGTRSTGRSRELGPQEGSLRGLGHSWLTLQRRHLCGARGGQMDQTRLRLGEGAGEVTAARAARTTRGSGTAHIPAARHGVPGAESAQLRRVSEEGAGVGAPQPPPNRSLEK